jgi:amino acid transporter
LRDACLPGSTPICGASQRPQGRHVTPPPVQEPLARRLSVLGLWMLAVNGMIGAGIFGIPAEAQRLAGAFSPWLFVTCALLIAPVILCFAQLASAFRGTGGPILYVGSAFGPFAGFQAGWGYYIARMTAFAANLNLLVTSIGWFWPGANGPAMRIGVLALVAAGMTWVNVVGAQAAMRSLGALTVLKLAPLVALALYGLFELDREVFAATLAPPDAGDLGAAILLAIYAYVGFESSLVPAGEARDPQRDLPRALLWSLAVTAALYALVQVAAQHLLPGLAGAQRPLVEAGEVLLGPTGAAIVVLGIVASVGGNLVGSMFSTSRVTYRLALDGQLPAWFARVHARHQTPANSVLFYGVACFALAVSGTFAWLAVLSVLVRLLLYAGCILAMPRVRRASGALPGAIVLPGGWAIPLAGLLVCLGLLTQVSLASVLATAALLAVGSGLYLVAARVRQRSR